MNSATAARSRALSLPLVRTLPVWAWLAGVTAASVLIRYAFGRRVVAPWIMVDELIYSELAKSFAESAAFAIRGEDVGTAYGIVYPVLLSPAFALFDSVPDAYAAAKAINALVVSLAAVPAYFLARRVLSPGLSLAAAVFAVALPSLLYAGTLMTENAFYPLFLCGALALVAALEKPTALRVAVLLAVVVLAYATRVQGLVFVPALLTAPLVLVGLGRERLRGLAAYRWFYVPVAGAIVAVLALQAARGRSPLDVLGAYRVAGDESYDVREVARWLLYHVAELDLSLAVAPLLALVLLAVSARRLDDRTRAFVAATIALAGWLVVVVAAFASRHSLRVEERNMFYVAPLLVTALLVWIERGLPRPRVPAALAAAALAALPALLPFSSLIGVSAVSDTFGLLPWWTVHEWGVSLDRLWVVVLLACSAVAALVVLVPRRFAVTLPALLLAFFVITAQPVEERIRGASIGALFQGITRPDRDWVDRAVARPRAVAAVYSGELDPLTVFENEFFSRAVGAVYTLAAPLPGGLDETPLRLDRRTGQLVDGSGSPVTTRYALVDRSVPLAGRAVARDDRKGLSVTRVDGPLRVTHALTGVYGDGWSGPVATYTRYRCAGGRVTAAVESDPNLFRRPQRLVARAAGRVVATGRIPRVGRARLTVPLHPGAEGRCTVRFVVTPTAVPGLGDERRLGTHFRGFRYSR